MKYNIRKAQLRDIEAILDLLEPYSKTGVILERKREDIENNIDSFFIAESENTIAGVVSFYKYSDALIEIRSLAVNENQYKVGIGSGLLNTLVESLLFDYPGAKIFALTYHPLFFKKYNFTVVPKDSLPEKIWKDCKNCINLENCNETALIFNKQKGFNNDEK
ncbi:MAG: GNAT family N-acetyltransferase [Spirochaetes bacterium]|nr:GNAT family N-acetyltransferase [Spirochaetota bacterium]